MILSISEILELCNKLYKKQDQINFLRKHDSVPLRGILKFAFDPSVEWLLPPGAPPYRPCAALDQEGQLYQNAAKLMRFVKGGGYDNIRQIKREALFISFLESLAPGDAELMTFVKDKMLPYPDVTPALVLEAFPGLYGASGVESATVVAETARPISASLPEPPRGHPKGTTGPKGISGFKNVSWNNDKKKWMAVRAFNGKRFVIGKFDDPKAADMAVEVFCRERGLVR